MAPLNFPKIEEEILEKWDREETFKKSVEGRPESKPYVFYDGPPFATGLPHYGHILSSVIKDAAPRYFTMKGYRVRRRWGWDCHGLPIESLIEKKLRISGKKQIEEMGVDKFNDACRAAVLTYTQEWKKMVRRIGRWIEFDNAYKTMDPEYMESVWWALKSIWDKGLIYEGRKVLQYCTRCETPVSKAETAMDDSYFDITEEAVTVKFKIRNPQSEIRKLFGVEGPVYLLAWTTTLWTLPGNVALAVGKDIEYVIVKEQGVKNKEQLIVAKARLPMLVDAYEVVAELKGADLVGLSYEPLFEMPAVAATGKRAYYVVPADFVTTEEGTGIVHTAVIYGEDDYQLGLTRDLPMVPILNERGEYNEAAPEFLRGKYIKQAEKDVKKDLEDRGLLFARSQHTHSYPHCWRCETPLIYNAIPAWFINIQKIKPRLIALNEKINWYPEHLQHGRFLNILETAPDWNISRNRYWATPLPFWKCQSIQCGETVCIGSVAELKEKAVNFDAAYKTDAVAEMDLHKHAVDRVKLRCEACGGNATRIPEVIDCWVESASMPFAEFHYPFENKKAFHARFPGHYIAEYIAQTRAWFYYLHVLGAILFDSHSFEHCVTTGTVLNERGEKLSKSKKNFTDPWEIIGEYGVDALRFYLMTSAVMEAEDLFFNDREVRDAYNKIINSLSNVVEFYCLYAEANEGKKDAYASAHPLDRWILSTLHLLIKEVTLQMDAYNTVKAGRPIKNFIEDLSQWYVRRSRERVKGKDATDRACALATLREVLLKLSQIMAPFTPFIAEYAYGKARGEAESVHLTDWPTYDKTQIDEPLLSQMEEVRAICSLALEQRAAAKIPVRQALSRLTVRGATLNSELSTLIKDEVNIEEIVAGSRRSLAGEDTLSVELDTTITPALREKGIVREIVRGLNAYRKELGLTPKDEVEMHFATDDQDLLRILRNETHALAIGREARLCCSVVNPKRPLDNPHAISIGAATLQVAHFAPHMKSVIRK